MSSSYIETGDLSPEQETFSNPWVTLELPAELDTPEKRLNAAANIIQNGGQSLTVLAMEPGIWRSYGQINRRIAELSGRNLVHTATTRDHFTYTIGPVGIAARSTLDDKEWILTEFGEALQPVIKFSWEKLLELGIDGMHVFGKTSHTVRDEDGEVISSPAQRRIAVLLELLAHGEMNSTALAQAGNMNVKKIAYHLSDLEKSGLINKLGVYGNEGKSITEYSLNSELDKNMSWPIFARKRNDKSRKNETTAYVTLSENIRQAILGLTEQGLPITIGNCTEQLMKIRGKSVGRSLVVSALAFYARENVLSVGELHDSMFTKVSITPLGQTVASELLLPLQTWSWDKSIPNDLSDQNPQRTLPVLFASVADSYAAKSSAKNIDPDDKASQIFHMVQNRPGISSAAIARELDISMGHVRKIVKHLVALGEITETDAEIGSSKFLNTVKLEETHG